MPENPGEPRGNPFLEALEEDFVVFRTERHVVQLNKFAVYRPNFILHTKDFALQTDPLDLSDFEAACEVISQLDNPYVVFFNCGLDAGSSQSHKHLQLIPKPPKDEFVPFPDLQSDNQQNSGFSNGDEQKHSHLLSTTDFTTCALPLPHCVLHQRHNSQTEIRCISAHARYTTA
jgi:ATP adenylyltransferase/5',5'''-P-1,P-4-tetraphosphate phosphorylase II